MSSAFVYKFKPRKETENKFQTKAVYNTYNFYNKAIMCNVSTGELMGELCAKHGSSVYASCRDMVIQGVRSNLERQPLDEAGQVEQEQVGKLREKLASDSQRVRTW